MRSRLLLLLCVFAVAAPVAAAHARTASPAASACTATAAGKHTRAQTLKVKLSAGCPSSGTRSGTLGYRQYPSIAGHGAYTINYARRTLHLRVPDSLSVKPAWRAAATSRALAVRIEAAPARRLSGRGSYTITGGFTATNGAVVHWSQTVKATASKITFGSIHISASLPGRTAMVIVVHQQRQFCASGRRCPYGVRAGTERSAFPASYTHATVTSASWFAIADGTLLSGRERPTILLESKQTGRILGRSDFQAMVKAP